MFKAEEEFGDYPVMSFTRTTWTLIVHFAIIFAKICGFDCGVASKEVYKWIKSDQWVSDCRDAASDDKKDTVSNLSLNKEDGAEPFEEYDPWITLVARDMQKPVKLINKDKTTTFVIRDNILNLEDHPYLCYSDEEMDDIAKRFYSKLARPDMYGSSKYMKYESLVATDYLKRRANAAGVRCRLSKREYEYLNKNEGVDAFQYCDDKIKRIQREEREEFNARHNRMNQQRYIKYINIGICKYRFKLYFDIFIQT